MITLRLHKKCEIVVNTSGKSLSLKKNLLNKSFSFALLQILFAVCDWKCRFGIFWNCLADFAILICMIGGISNFLANDYPGLKRLNWLASFKRVFQLELAAVIFAGIDRENINRYFYFNCKIWNFLFEYICIPHSRFTLPWNGYLYS